MLYLSLFITIVVIFLHLFAKYKKIKSLAFWTKPFLIPLIFISFFLLSDHLDVFIVNPVILIIVCGLYTLGDILLLFENESYMTFVCGACSFLVGHLFYIYYYLSFKFSIYALVVALVIWLFMFILYSKAVIDTKKTDYVPHLVYGGTICLLGIGVMAAFDTFSLYYILGILGTASFALSDCLIALNVIGKIERRPFTIMSTYLSANILLLIGVLGLLV